MEHIERAGVHSGDSMAVYPPQTLSKEVMDKLIDYTTRIARGLKIIGLLKYPVRCDERRRSLRIRG